MHAMKNTTIRVLLIEDNPGDIRLTQEIFKEGSLKCELEVAQDGYEAMEFLKNISESEEKNYPDLILLDLNLPGLNGKEILQKLKNSEDFKRIPVVVLTTSHAPDDINSSYDLHANCYITKPIDVEQFIQVMQNVESFWLKIAKLPDPM